MSEPQMPTASMRTCTSPGPGSGSSHSTKRNCRSPYSSAMRLFTAHILLVRVPQSERRNVVEHRVEIGHVAVLLGHIVAHFRFRAGQVTEGKPLCLHPGKVSPAGAPVKEDVTACQFVRQVLDR